MASAPWPHQTPQVVVAVGVLLPEGDGVPVAALRRAELLQAVLHDAQVHPRSSEVRPAKERNADVNATLDYQKGVWL